MTGVGIQACVGMTGVGMENDIPVGMNDGMQSRNDA